jgi:hypothetical protein
MKINDPYILAFGFAAQPAWWIGVCRDLRIDTLLATMPQRDVTDPQPATPKYRMLVEQYRAAGIEVGMHCLSHLLAKDSAYLSDPAMLFSGEPIEIEGLLLPSVEALPTIAGNLAEFYRSNGFSGLYLDGMECGYQQYPGAFGSVQTQFALDVLGRLPATPQPFNFSILPVPAALLPYKAAWGGRDTCNLPTETFAAWLARREAGFADNPGLQPDMGWIAFWSAPQHAYTADNWRAYFAQVRRFGATWNLEMSCNPPWYESKAEIRNIIRTRGGIMALIDELEVAVADNAAAAKSQGDKLTAAMAELAAAKLDNERLIAQIDKLKQTTTALNAAG